MMLLRLQQVLLENSLSFILREFVYEQVSTPNRNPLFVSQTVFCRKRRIRKRLRPESQIVYLHISGHGFGKGRLALEPRIASLPCTGKWMGGNQIIRVRYCSSSRKKPPRAYDWLCICSSSCTEAYLMSLTCLFDQTHDNLSDPWRNPG